MTDERPAPPLTERTVLARLCASLPALRERAEAGFWADTLDMHVADILAGGSVLTATEQLGLTAHGRFVDLDATRGPRPADAATDLWPAPSLVGDYHCPLRRCFRRESRDDRGRPPRCSLTGEPMTFASRG